MRKRFAVVAAWVLATGIAIAVGVAAVAAVDANIRVRGPIGAEFDATGSVATAAPTSTATADDAPGTTATFPGEYGVFVAECRGTWAYGREALPASGRGWRVMSLEEGPDDDVEATFSNGRTSIGVEVFCNRGRPTISEIERHNIDPPQRTRSMVDHDDDHDDEHDDHDDEHD